MADARKLSVSALMRVEKDSAYSNITLDRVLSGANPPPEDRALATALFYGVLDRKITIDYLLGTLIKKPLKNISPYTMQILRIGIYQLIFMDKIPESAAVNESVRLVKGSTEKYNAGFVNAVLRACIRSDNALPAGDTPDALSVRYSCPELIVKNFITDYGIEAARALLERSLTSPDIVIRVNTLKTTSEKLTEWLAKNGISCNSCGIENALSITGGIDISSNILYNDGYFHVQDTASQLCCGLLNLKPGESVLDLCAAPGGKSFTMAELMNNTGRVVSCDIYPQRVRLIADGAKRLGLTVIEPLVNDASKENTQLHGFDAVLCDVPCSGLGILRRKPEIKYKENNNFEELVKIQRDILNRAADYLKPSGRIVYSTCTLRRAENEEITSGFLSEHKDFALMTEKTYLPHIDGTDGFYTALLVRREDAANG